MAEQLLSPASSLPSPPASSDSRRKSSLIRMFSLSSGRTTSIILVLFLGTVLLTLVGCSVEEEKTATTTAETRNSATGNAGSAASTKTNNSAADKEASAASATNAGIKRSSLNPGVASTKLEVHVALFRQTVMGKERLMPGARVRIGDAIFMEIEVSALAHLYVVNADNGGGVYGLFPMPGQSDLANPLSPGVTHQLPGPGSRAWTDGTRGQQLRWSITSSHGWEEVVVVASTARLPKLESEFASLQAPQFNHGVFRRDDVRDWNGPTQGIGGFLNSTSHGSTPAAREAYERIKEIADNAQASKGVWVRQFNLENPDAD